MAAACAAAFASYEVESLDAQRGLECGGCLDGTVTMSRLELSRNGISTGIFLVCGRSCFLCCILCCFKRDLVMSYGRTLTFAAYSADGLCVVSAALSALVFVFCVFMYILHDAMC